MFATAIVAIDARLPARYTASLCKRVKWFSHWANSSTETDDGKGCDFHLFVWSVVCSADLVDVAASECPYL